MKILGSGLRLSIAKDPAPDVQCAAGLFFDDPTLRYYPPVVSPCGVCGGVDRVGALRRVPQQDLWLRRGPAVLTCTACSSVFLRVDGAW